MPQTVYVELWDIPGLEGVDDFSFAEYYKGEQELLTPALEKMGFILRGSWYSGEQDSFGPLGREIRATSPDGLDLVIFYG